MGVVYGLFNYFLLKIGALFSAGVLYREVNWELFLLSLPALKWVGISVVGAVFSNTLIWILKGFIDD